MLIPQTLANPAPKDLVCTIVWLLGSFISAIALLTTDALAAGDVQVDWRPNIYKVVCNPPDSCQLDAIGRKSFEQNLSLAVTDIRKAGFKAPISWGKRIGAGTNNDFIEVQESGLNNVAYVSSTAWCNNPASAWADMRVGTEVNYFLDNGAEHWVYNSAAHEAFHLVQFGYPFWDLNQCGKVPGWIMEGTATAVATDAMIKRFDGVDPSDNPSEARQIAGMRRYDIPMPDRHGKGREEIYSGIPRYQFTSSFWQHLATTYHNGKFNYLADYMQNTAKNGDWVAWLRNNVELDTGKHLGMVFAGFLANYAGWGDRGYTGQVFKRNNWLKESFGGCESVHLNKNNASGYVDVALKPLAGKCIEVTVSTIGESGLNEGESVAVQIAAVVEPSVSRHGMTMQTTNGRDGLHLALAASSDKKKFHCANEIRRQGKSGVARCIFVPDDGKIRLDGAETDARVWNVIAQEKDDSPELQPPEGRQQPAEGKGNLTNLYVASFTPVSVGSEDTRDGGSDPMMVRFYFVLNFAKIQSPELASVAPGAAKKQFTAELSPTRSSDPQTTLPKQDKHGMPANSFALPAILRPQAPPPPPTPDSAQALIGKLSSVMVSSRTWGGGSSTDVIVLVLHPAERKKDEYELRPLSIGEIGSFPVIVEGSLDNEPLIAQDVGSINIEEFTDLVLRARFQLNLCRLSDMKPKQGCSRPLPFSGEIVKAFAGTRLPGYHMRIEDTPGMQMYRKTNEQAMQQGSISQPSQTTDTSPGNDAGVASSGTKEQLQTCTCTCEEQGETNRQAQALRARAAAGEEVTISQIMGTTRCSASCQREYMICLMDRHAAEKKAEQAARDSTQASTENCDCSCEQMAATNSRAKELEKQLMAGGTLSIEAMKSLTRCAAVCQPQHMTCLKKGYR